MHSYWVFFLALHLSLLSIKLPLWGQLSTATAVRFATSLGDIDVILLSEDAPRTVQNFLNYVNRGLYTNSFIHRSVPGFVIQGGGYTWSNGQVGEVPQFAPVLNEFKVSNTRGTLAMAKLASGPNTATNQWFFNLADNSSNLDRQNGGFTVFGRVANAAGLAVMDRIAAQPIYNAGSPFDSLPLVGYTGGPVAERHLVMVRSITVLNWPAIAKEGVITASSFGGFPVAAPGSYVEIYGANLGPEQGVTWSAGDFVGGVAPTRLEDVSVTVNGIPAYVYFASRFQANVQIPENVPTGAPATIVVTRGGIASQPATIMIQPRAPGLLAPPSFKVGDKQFVAALHADGRLVSNGSIPQLPAAPAKRGETLVFFGTGFGPIEPSVNSIAGKVAEGATNLVHPVEFFFGGEKAQVLYSGLAPGLVGLYQFNVTVSPATPVGDVELRVVQQSEALTQKLWISVEP